jgi:phosphoribosylpyrophosphate synthetase
MVKIANQLKKSGAKNIYVSSIHGIFSGNSGKIIKKSPINKIFVTNSYSDKEFWNQKIVHISIGKSVAKVIAKLHNNQSLENFRQNKNY